MAVAIQNHAPAAVHMASLSLSCADGTAMFMKNDAIGRLNSPGTIEPGKSWTFFYPLADLREVQIGRVYTADAETVQRVLRQLEVFGS
jgi:hypothetical protein